MASQTEPFSPGKRLIELLEEQQEPFLLEVYLLENGHSCKLLKSKSAIQCWPRDACRRLLRFTTHGFKSGGRLPSCDLFSLGKWKLIRKALKWESRAPVNGMRCVVSCFTAVGSEARASRFKRLLHSCEHVLDGKRHWKRMEDLKQLSPVSVLELHSDEGCSAHNHSVEEENPSTSTLSSEVSEELHSSACFSYLYKYKQGIQDFGISKQELRERRDVAMTGKFIGVDILGTRREWNQFQAETKEIGMAIEGFIFEEIREEVVVELLASLFLLKKGSL